MATYQWTTPNYKPANSNAAEPANPALADLYRRASLTGDDPMGNAFQLPKLEFGPGRLMDNLTVTPEARTGTGQSGQAQVASAPKQELTLATENNSGWKPPSYAGNVWQAIAAGAIRNGWGLDPQGATRNNGIIVGYGSANPVTLIMPVDYAYAQDTARWFVAGAGYETALQRAIRKTADEMAANPNLNAMQVLAKWMKFVDNEARQQGKTSGFNMTQMGGQGGGADAGNPVGGTPLPVPPPASEDPVAPPAEGDDDVEDQPTGGGGGGSANATPRTYGATTLTDPLVTATGLMNDPTMAGRFVRQAQGLTGPTTSRMGRLRDQLYGRMLAAYLNLTGAGGNSAGNLPDDLGSFVQALGGGSNALIEAVKAQARGAMTNPGAMADEDFEQLLGYSAALGGVGKGSIGQAGLDFALQGLLTDQMDDDITSGGADTLPLHQRYQQTNPFRTALERYLAITGAR